MASTTTPNMSLIVPTVGQEPGPAWANEINGDLGILDQHNHSSGQGVQITPNGLNINTDLSINDNNLTFVKTVRFQALSSTLAGMAPNLGVIYVAGNELVYNDIAGNVVPITNNGSVNAGAGSITGLPSGTASASYSSLNQTFTWQSATSTPANMDFASAILRNLSSGSKGLTLNPPSAMAADIVETLPTPPAVSSFMTMDNAGNMGVAIPISKGLTNSNIANQTITQGLLAPRATGSTVAAGGYATTASSSNTTSTSSSSLSNITGFSVTITTTGRPVVVGLTADGAGSGSVIYLNNGATNVGLATFVILRGGVAVSFSEMGSQTSGGGATPNFLNYPVSIVNYIDSNSGVGLPAGTYTYTMQWAMQGSGTNLQLINAIMYAYEQ